MKWGNTVRTCVRMIAEDGCTFGTVERSLAKLDCTKEERKEIMQAIRDEISRRKKGDAAD